MCEPVYEQVCELTHLSLFRILLQTSAALSSSVDPPVPVPRLQDETGDAVHVHVQRVRIQKGEFGKSG